MNKIISYSLAFVHMGWALSLIIDSSRYLGKLAYPPIFSALHILIALVLALNSVVGGVLSTVVMAYYWVAVKPLEPIAEPQSVGILFLSASLLAPLMRRRLTPHNLQLLGLRLGIAYPYLEWGLDAFRNPLHFYEYITQNPATSFLATQGLIEETVILLGSLELLLALTISFGFAVRPFSALSLAVLTVFMVVAGYPLALPQNIALAAASLILVKNGGGEYSIQSAPRLLGVLMR